MAFVSSFCFGIFAYAERGTEDGPAAARDKGTGCRADVVSKMEMLNTIPTGGFPTVAIQWI